jgi:hypothetical protein
MHPCRLRQRAQDLLHAIQGPGQQWRVVTIGRGAHGSERDAIGIDGHRAFDASLPPIHRAPARPFAAARSLGDAAVYGYIRTQSNESPGGLRNLRDARIFSLAGLGPGWPGKREVFEAVEVAIGGSATFASVSVSWRVCKGPDLMGPGMEHAEERVNYSPPTSRTAFCIRGGLRQSAPLRGSPRAASTAARTRLETWSI